MLMLLYRLDGISVFDLYLRCYVLDIKNERLIKNNILDYTIALVSFVLSDYESNAFKPFPLIPSRNETRRVYRREK